MEKRLSPWGTQCKKQMVELNKTLADIAEETNYSRNYISAVMNGRMIVPDETANKISKALQVDERLPRASYH